MFGHCDEIMRRDEIRLFDGTLKGLSHEIDFKNVDSNLQNLA